MFSSSVYGLCIKGKHIIGGGSPEICKAQREFELKKQKDAFETKKENYEMKRIEANKPKQENTGQQSGNEGTIFNLGALAGSNSSADSAAKAANSMLVAKHNITLEWQVYKFPKMAQLDRQMPHQFFLPKGLRYDWYFSKRFGFGAIYEQYTLTNTKSFDPITSNQNIRETVEIINADGTSGTATRDVNKDIPYLFPGAIDRVEYQRLWYFITFNSSLGHGSDWNAVVRFGSALICNADIYFNDVDLSLDENEYATQPETREITAVMPMFFDFAIERWFEGTRLSAYIRFVEAQNETSSYLDYVSMGGTTVGLAATFGIPMFGYLK